MTSRQKVINLHGFFLFQLLSGILHYNIHWKNANSFSKGYRYCYFENILSDHILNTFLTELTSRLSLCERIHSKVQIHTKFQLWTQFRMTSEVSIVCFTYAKRACLKILITIYKRAHLSLWKYTQKEWKKKRFWRWSNFCTVRDLTQINSKKNEKFFDEFLTFLVLPGFLSRRHSLITFYTIWVGFSLGFQVPKRHRH